MSYPNKGYYVSLHDWRDMRTGVTRYMQKIAAAVVVDEWEQRRITKKQARQLSRIFARVLRAMRDPKTSEKEKFELQVKTRIDLMKIGTTGGQVDVMVSLLSTVAEHMLTGYFRSVFIPSAITVDVEALEVEARIQDVGLQDPEDIDAFKSIWPLDNESAYRFAEQQLRIKSGGQP